MNKRNVLIIISILTFIVIVGGVSYSYFVYNKNIGDVTLTTGEISIDLSGISGNKTLSSVIPLSDNDGKNTSDYFDFTVNSSVDTERIYYEVYLLPQSGNTLNTSYLKTYLTDQNNVEIRGITIYDDLGNSEVENGKVIYKGIIETNSNGTTRNETKDFRLRLWIDEEYSEQASKIFNFDIYLYAKNVDSDFVLPYGANLLRNAIANKESQGGTCSNITWTDSEDNITYLSGTNDCIDMNYVWYSGKLWRITAIYPDGAMKLVTENNITTMVFDIMGNNKFYVSENNNSIVYQWLNEDFYDSLYNPKYILDTTKQWNTNSSSNISTKLNNTSLVNANVGLLNSYEYYNSYRLVDSANGYLNISFIWWLLNYRNSDMWAVNGNGYGYTTNSNTSYGVRPTIYIKPNVELIGLGSFDTPYRIVGDKALGKREEYLNTRLSGEYIKIKSGNSEQLFRIIDVENNKTKIIAMEYANNSEKRVFSTDNSDTSWGSGTTTGADTWYTYLNTIYYPNLVNIYGNLFDSGVYYFGESNNNYKLSICANLTSGNTKECEKTSRMGMFNIGLLHYGELFAVQSTDSYNDSEMMWLLNASSNSAIWSINAYNCGVITPSTNLRVVRPTLHLKSTVKILSGSGTENDPYIVGL